MLKIFVIYGNFDMEDEYGCEATAVLAQTEELAIKAFDEKNAARDALSYYTKPFHDGDLKIMELTAVEQKPQVIDLCWRYE